MQEPHQWQARRGAHKARADTRPAAAHVARCCTACRHGRAAVRDCRVAIPGHALQCTIKASSSRRALRALTPTGGACCPLIFSVQASAHLVQACHPVPDVVDSILPNAVDLSVRQQNKSRRRQTAVPQPASCAVLLQVDGLDACRARALHKAGLRTPLAVLQADEHMLKEALAEALPRGMQRQMGPSVKGGTLAAAQVPICPALCQPVNHTDRGIIWHVV